MKTIYRIENETTMHGMWYRLDGTFDPFIYRLTDGKSKELPMEFSEKYSQGGLKWFSGGSTREQMQLWFSPKDALELFKNGYSLYEFKADKFIEEENQTLFVREGIIDKTEIPLDMLWDMEGLV